MAMLFAKLFPSAPIPSLERISLLTQNRIVRKGNRLGGIGSKSNRAVSQCGGWLERKESGRLRLFPVIAICDSP